MKSSLVAFLCVLCLAMVVGVMAYETVTPPTIDSAQATAFAGRERRKSRRHNIARAIVHPFGGCRGGSFR